MKIVHVIAAAAVLSLPVAVASAPAMAASAHNSQAGGLPSGSTSNSSAPAGMHKRQMQTKKRMKGM